VSDWRWSPAPTKVLDSFDDKYLNCLLKLIAVFMEWDDEDLRYVCVTDWSSLGDFGLLKDEYESLSKSLGFGVSGNDHLIDVLKQMRAKEQNEV
jgi:hypothetical protein